MRIRFLDRLLSAVSGLLVLFIGVCVFVFGVGVFPFKIDISIFEDSFVIEQRLIMVGIALLLGILGVHGLSLLFRKRKDKGFIIQNTELGDMSISMHAMESMVKRCVDTHEELRVTHTRIQRVRDGVSVEIRVSLASGVNIPLTVNALQKQIKHYITSCSGVDVKEVRVMVETNGSQQPKSAEVIAPDLAAADASVAAHGAHGAEGEQGKEPIHLRIFRHEQQQQTVPPPPQEEENREGVMAGEPEIVRAAEEWTEAPEEAQAAQAAVEIPDGSAEGLGSVSAEPDEDEKEEE